MKHDRRPTSPPVISWFDDFGRPNPYAFLSNFYIGAPIVWNGASYETGEHLFAALKAATNSDHETVRNAPGPAAAKTTGRTIDLRSDWERVKYDAMVLVLALKFTLDRPEGRRLLETGDALLVEGTYWSDTVWGVDLSEDGADLPWERYGRNWLGRLLMARRAELRAEQMYGVAADIDAVSRFAAYGKPMKPPAPPVEQEPFDWAAVDGLPLVDGEVLGVERFKVADRTPFCWPNDDGVCKNPSHIHADNEAGTFVERKSAWQWPIELSGGRLSHTGCDHAASRNARARCRRRARREGK